MNHFALPQDGRAAVFRAVGAPLTIENYPLPQPAGTEVLVKISCSTICGSDLHSYTGSRHSPMPCVLGHEMVGHIVATGPEGAQDFRGRELQIGDRITWSMVWSCGRCFYCQKGLRSKCEKLMKFGHEELAPNRVFVGGMAEYCHLPKGCAIFRVPDNVPDAVASPSNCATATVAATMRYAGSLAGQAVIIHGAGMLGQTACAMAAVGGATEVMVLEPNQLRREQTLKFGATIAIDSTQAPETVREIVLARTQGRGADVSIELSGYPEAIELGLGLLRFGGRMVMAGATFPSRPVQWPAEQIVRRLLQIVGVYNYNPEDLEAGLEFLSKAQGRFPFEELVGKSFSLDQINAAFAFAREQRPPRVAVLPWCQ
ncbi:MAG: zinc-binding dehydrogenase [Planctomycetaceae bacterium]|nr:zinc-binding dehydrogenase [Planctomycetaceae bacterium]